MNLQLLSSVQNGGFIAQSRRLHGHSGHLQPFFKARWPGFSQLFIGSRNEFRHDSPGKKKTKEEGQEGQSWLWRILANRLGSVPCEAIYSKKLSFAALRLLTKRLPAQMQQEYDQQKDPQADEEITKKWQSNTHPLWSLCAHTVLCGKPQGKKLA